MTYHMTCVTCGKAFEAGARNAKYCPPCRIQAHKDDVRRQGEARKAFTARANEIAGRAEFNAKTPRPCRCGTPARPVVGYGYPADGTVTRHVFCTQCGRRGKDAQSPSEAIKAWNKEA